MNDDDIRQFLRQGTRAPRRRVDLAEVHRRGLRRRASVVGGGATLALALVAAVIVSLPPSGDVVVFSGPSRGLDTESRVPLPATSDPEPAPDEPAPSTPDAEEAAPPQPEETPQTGVRPPPPAAAPDQEPETVAEEEEEEEEEAPDYGAAFWDRRFSAVAVTEQGQARPQPEFPINIRLGRHPSHEPHQRDLLEWRGGCNPTFTPVAITRDRLHLDFDNSIHSTGGPPCEGEYREQSQWIEEFLRTDPFWRLDGDRLWLWSGDAVIQFEEEHRGEAVPAIVPTDDGPRSSG